MENSTEWTDQKITAWNFTYHELAETQNVKKATFTSWIELKSGKCALILDVRIFHSFHLKFFSFIS